MAPTPAAVQAASLLKIDDLINFHQIDRELFSRLVFDLGRDIMQSMEVVSLWMWMEEIGYPGLILKMISQSNEIIEALAEEAVACLYYIASPIPPPPSSGGVPLQTTLSLLEGEHISIEYFYENREIAIYKILRKVDCVCKTVFHDIVQQALSFSNLQAPANPTGNLFGPGYGYGPESGLSSLVQVQQQSEENVRLSPILFGTGFKPILPRTEPATGFYGGGVTVDAVTAYEMGESSILAAQSTRLGLNPMAQPWAPQTNDAIESNNTKEIVVEGEEVIPTTERTLFATFSRGYPILESEVLDFFVRTYGADCIENIYMQDVEGRHRQPLYARIVLTSTAKMSEILDGKERVKFTINGRHLVVRKFE